MTFKSRSVFTITLTCILLISSGCIKKKKIWIYTSVYPEVIEEMKAPLAAAVSGVEIEWYQSGSENVATKLNAELAAGKAKADIIMTSDPFWYFELKKSGKLMTYPSANAKKIPLAFQDPDSAFNCVRLPVMVIGYNSQAFQAEEVPKSWKDFLDPKWKGKLSMPSPLEAGTSLTSVALISKLYGWDFFRDLRKQEILASGGNEAVITRIETRERPVGMVLLENILKAQAKGSPVRPIYPSDGVIPISSPIAIMQDSENPEIAKKIYEWLLTSEAQHAIINSGMYSLMPGVAPPKGARAFFGDVDKILMAWSPQLLEQLYGERGEIKAKFSELVLH